MSLANLKGELGVPDTVITIGRLGSISASSPMTDRRKSWRVDPARARSSVQI